MIVSQNIKQPIDKFEELLFNADGLLKKEAKASPRYFLQRDADKFETDIYDCFLEASKGTSFEGSIELVSGHKFPDIVINKFYGVEVKTTKQNHWKSTGNSVFETTRIDNVENIFIYFAKLAEPIDFKYRKYQECLYDIAVTHSPRYLINMTLEKGSSIFDKMGIEYDDLRKLKNPVKPFINYFKKTMKPGEEPWWISENEKILLNSRFIELSDLAPEEKNKIIVEAMILFPKIFGKSSTKFKGVSEWLASQHSIVAPSLRDNFTAGGKVSLYIGSKEYNNIPRIFKNLNDSISFIISRLPSISKDVLTYYWGEFDDNNTHLDQWIKLFFRSSIEAHFENSAFIVELIRSNYPHELPDFLKEKVKELRL